MEITTMKKFLVVLTFLTTTLPAQNEWTLQPWMQVEGTYNGQKLGSSVGFVGKVGDSTQISVSDVNGIKMYRIKNPNDTTPRFFFAGSNCLLGDFNGDGIKDLVVGGNPTKIYKGVSTGIFDTTFFTKYKEADGDNFGSHIAIGKINQDQCDDLIIADVGPNLYRGKVYIFFGGVQMENFPTYTLQGDSALSFFGWNVTTGDLNIDGYDDIVVRGYDQSQTGPNGTIRFAYIKIFLGGNIVDTIAWKYLRGGDDGGLGIASFDVNGDGKYDLLWTTPDTLGRIHVHFGGVSFDTIPNLRLNDPGAGIGYVIVNAGDMNGDGYDDIAVSSPYKTFNFGFVAVYGAGPKIDSKFDAAAGLSVPSLFGWSMVSIGDINGDGLGDILVGAPQYQWDEDRGKWFVLLGDTNILVTAIKQEQNLRPRKFELLQNYPNPFNPSTTISFVLKEPAKVTLSIFNVLGQKLEDLVKEDKKSGDHKINFDAANYSSGIYFYQLTAVNKQGDIQFQTKQMTLIK